MALCRLLLIAGLIGYTAASTVAAQSNAVPPACCEGNKATATCDAASRFYVIVKRTDECRMAVVTTAGLTGRPPCLCRVAAEPQLAATGHNGTNILALYAASPGRHPIGSHHIEACKGWNLSTPVLPDAKTAAVLSLITASLEPTRIFVLYRGCGKGNFDRGLNFANSYCEVEKTGDKARAMRRAARLATGRLTPTRLASVLASYVLHVLRDRTVQGCKDRAASLDLGGCVPCLCQTAVKYVTTSAGLKATDLLSICGGLRLGGAHHKAAAASCEVRRFRSWSFVECPGFLLIFALLIAFTRKKNFDKEERELKWEHAHGMQQLDAKLLPSEKAKQREGITRWQEPLSLKCIFSISQQRSFESLHRKRLTRFVIMSIIILGGLFSAIRPVQAVPISINLHLYFGEGNEYYTWSEAIYTTSSSRSQWEARRQGQIWYLLEDQTLPTNEPPAWFNITVHDGEEWFKFVQRSDNYWVAAYENSRASHTLQDCTHLFPDAITLDFPGTYKGMNGERGNLTNLNFNRIKAKNDLLILSQYNHGVDDQFPMKVAFTRYVVMLAEGQRFTEVDDCIKGGWDTECYLKRPDILFVNYQELSCGVLEDWKPDPNGPDPRSAGWLSRRIRKYKKLLKDLDITEEQAPFLLRMLIKSPACAHNMQDVFPIGA